MNKRINVLLVLFILLIQPQFIFTQDGWIQQTSGINNTLIDVFFTDQNNGWVVGANGTILKTTDGGTNWIPCSSGTNNELHSVFFIDTEIGWSVGLNGTILKSTDGGINWSSYPSGIYNTLYSVFFIDQNNGWIAGGYTMFRTTNSGVDWLTQSIGTDNYLQSVFFINQDTGWAGGRNLLFSKIFKTTDGGINWSSQIEIPTEEFISVQFINPNIGWAVGIHLEGPPGPYFGTIFSTSDGGNNWIPGQSFPVLKEAYFIDQHTGWVVDNWDANTGRIHKTTDGGLNWTIQITGTPNIRLFSIFLIDANMGWAVGDNGTILRTTNGGTPASFQLSVIISDGWNMVSVPGINPDGMEVNSWWENLTGTIYNFVPGSGYAAITTTVPGEGYWLKNNGTEIYNYPAIAIVTHDPIGATSGWNMLGGYEDTVAVTTLTTTPEDKIILPIYKYVPGTGYQTATHLEPGYGYWVKVSENCQINIPDVLSEGKPK
jgi:photosystem II stability/assembly factor-like uncharacterized protein